MYQIFLIVESCSAVLQNKPCVHSTECRLGSATCCVWWLIWDTVRQQGHDIQTALHGFLPVSASVIKFQMKNDFWVPLRLCQHISNKWFTFFAIKLFITGNKTCSCFLLAPDRNTGLHFTMQLWEEREELLKFCYCSGQMWHSSQR